MTQRRRWMAIGAAVLMAAALTAGWCQAQEAAAAPAGAPVEEATDLLTLLKQGGVLMWPLGFLSVATIALAVYGFLTVRESKMLTPEQVPLLHDALQKLHLQEAIEICQRTPSLLTNTVLAGLQRISDGVLDVPSMEKAMEEASVEETSAGLKVISYLSIIAQIAPMLGLLGTVSGMIKAFAKIGKGAMGKPEVLAADIGEALVTTATGLLIGIPAMFLYFFLKSRYTSTVTKLGRVVGNLSHSLVAASRRTEGQEPDMAPATDAGDAEQGVPAAETADRPAAE